MKRSLAAVVVITLAAACGGAPRDPGGTTPGGGTTEPGDPGDEPTTPTKRRALSWVNQPASPPDVEPPRSLLTLAITDETGSTQNHKIGEFTGVCSDLGPRGDAKSVMQCWWAGAGIQLHLVVRGQDIVILQVHVDEALPEPDPMDREEIDRITIPSGAAIIMGPAA